VNNRSNKSFVIVYDKDNKYFFGRYHYEFDNVQHKPYLYNELFSSTYNNVVNKVDRILLLSGLNYDDDNRGFGTVRIIKMYTMKEFDRCLEIDLMIHQLHNSIFCINTLDELIYDRELVVRFFK
jgi:hypothetical protein